MKHEAGKILDSTTVDIWVLPRDNTITIYIDGQYRVLTINQPVRVNLNGKTIANKSRKIIPTTDLA